MRFAYDDYLRECFSQPVLNLLWTLPFIVILLLPALLTLSDARQKSERESTGRLVLIIMSLLLIIGFPLHKQIGTLAKTNGVAILQERNAEPRVLTGVIEAIEKPERNADTRFTYEGKHDYGAWLTIDGVRYYTMTVGDFCAGDTVTLEYLPKSRCVLYLAPAESTNAEE